MHITFFVWCRGGFPRNGFFSDDGFDPLQVRWANVTSRYSRGLPRYESPSATLAGRRRRLIGHSLRGMRGDGNADQPMACGCPGQSTNQAALANDLFIPRSTRGVFG
jgi:hypothetical protein